MNAGNISLSRRHLLQSAAAASVGLAATTTTAFTRIGDDDNALGERDGFLIHPSRGSIMTGIPPTKKRTW